MTEVKPFIKCVDFWPGKIPPEKINVYKEMVREEQIRKPTVVVNESTGSTTVEYYAIVPHEWILEQMAGRCAG